MDINKIKEDNFEVIGIIANYLINHSDFINEEMVNSLIKEGFSKEDAFFYLFCEVCGLNIVDDEHDLDLVMRYFKKAIKRLDKNHYINNPYYKNIKVNEEKMDNWEFKYEKYKPYEAFVYNDLLVESNFVEIPRIGYFDEEFEYLAVLENGNEWMLITLNEINTMQGVIDEVSGDVVAFGLGLGYFAYMVSIKENVNGITIIEKDKNVIKLFEKFILPQFEYKDKVKIICCDAFEYAKNMTGYDYAFVDLWHDVSDGVELYLKMKKLEKSNINYRYWIEDSLKSYIRWNK